MRSERSVKLPLVADDREPLRNMGSALQTK